MSEKLIKQDKNLEAGADAEVWEIMLTGLLLIVCSAYIPIATHDLEHGVGGNYPQWWSHINQDNAL